MKKIETVNEFLAVRQKLKAVQQLSWEVSQLDRNSNTDDVNEYPTLIKIYKERITQALLILKGGD